MTDDSAAMDSAAASSGTAMGDANGLTGPHKDDKEFVMTAAHSD